MNAKLEVAELEVKVTKIGNRYHARLLRGAEVLDEMACILREDIGYICRVMLRWHDKLGGSSKFAWASRHRKGIKNDSLGNSPKGRVEHIGRRA